MLEGSVETISDGVVGFRDISPSDMELLYVWRMEEDTRLMFRHTEVVPFEFHRARVERHLQGGQPDRWFIIEAAEKRVGTISLYNFSEDRKTCDWGRFIIAPESRNLGYGKRALKLLIGYSQSIGVKTLNCEVLESNGVALRLYRRLGFVETGAQDCAGRTFLSMAADLEAHR
jgi:RimJ/RimL family protein N-acetyltransferase